MSWGQHFFHWNTPEYWAVVNRQQETNLHNTYAVFEKYPRAILEIGVLIGGIHHSDSGSFHAAYPRQCGFSLFFPPAALLPASLIVFGIKIADMAFQKGHVRELLHRPSETIELYLYFFILAYLIVFSRRIGELETDQAGASSKD